MKTLRTIAVLLLLTTMVSAQDEKTTMVNLMKNEREYLAGMFLDKLGTIEASPKWWERINEPVTGAANGGARHTLAIVANGMISVAKEMGWGDLVATDSSGGYNGLSPLLPDMVDSWKGKLSLKVILQDEPTATGIPQVISNLNYVTSPITNNYCNHPRSGKFFLTLQLNAKAPKATYGWNKQLTDFKVVIPAYSSVSQSDMETYLKIGK